MTGDTKDTGIPIPDDALGTIAEGTESVRRTIVGGRPLDRRRRKVRIPIGIEKVLCAAAADREFREQLLMARADALVGTNLEVSSAEATILSSVSEGALRTLIDSIDLKLHRKRSFFRGIAAASLAATTAMATGCIEAEEAQSKGIEPDWPDSVTPDVQPLAGVNLQDSVEEFTVPEDVARAPEVMQDAGDMADDIVEVREVLHDLGNTSDIPPDIVQAEEVMDAGGALPDLPELKDADEIDVDIQPVPAGIPPMEDVKEPK